MGGFAAWPSAGPQWPWRAHPNREQQQQAPKTPAAMPEASQMTAERVASGLSATTSRPSALLETAKLLGAGGFAGAFSKTCTAPLARLTILYQVQALQPQPGAAKQLSMGRAFAHLVRQEGVRSLWKGNGVTVVHRIPYSAINFWAYERITEAWRARLPKEQASQGQDFSRRLLAGGLAGSIACAVAYPLDLVRTRLSAQVSSNYYCGIGGTLRTIVRDEGFKALYRGLGATLVQVAPSLAINYAAYESLRAGIMEAHPEQDAPTMAQSLVCGSAAGLLSSTLTFPLDLVRRRMQLEGQRGAATQHASYAAVVRSVYARQGLRGFYQGIWPEYYKVIPGVAIAFCMYELAKSVTGVTTNKDGR